MQSIESFNDRAFPWKMHQKPVPKSENYGGVLGEVKIILTNENGCEKSPHENMDERCKFIYYSH